jgi:ActR/RegA family two-component response regulator
MADQLAWTRFGSAVLLANADGEDELRAYHCTGELAAVITECPVEIETEISTERTLELIAEYGSISATARALHVSRSTIQRRLKRKNHTGDPTGDQELRTSLVAEAGDVRT